MPQGDLFAIFETSLSDYEREALEFLYAYMPLADIADYSGEFHLMNVRASRQAADEMPWGKRYSRRYIPALCSSGAGEQ